MGSFTERLNRKISYQRDFDITGYRSIVRCWDGPNFFDYLAMYDDHGKNSMVNTVDATLDQEI